MTKTKSEKGKRFPVANNNNVFVIWIKTLYFFSSSFCFFRPCKIERKSLMWIGKEKREMRKKHTTKVNVKNEEDKRK